MDIERFRLICLLITMAMILITSTIMAHFRPKLENITFDIIIILSVIVVIVNALIFGYRFTMPI